MGMCSDYETLDPITAVRQDLNTTILWYYMKKKVTVHTFLFKKEKKNLFPKLPKLKTLGK